MVEVRRPGAIGSVPIFGDLNAEARGVGIKKGNLSLGYMKVKLEEKSLGSNDVGDVRIRSGNRVV